MSTHNSIYVRRRGRILTPPSCGGEPLPLHLVASVAKNVEALGYAFSPALIDACRALPLAQLVDLQEELLAILKALRGAHVKFAPLYPNFPDQVMEMREADLYLNALVHYWSGGQLRPVSIATERSPLRDDVELTRLDRGTVAEFEGLFGQIASANAALSPLDSDDLTWFVRRYRDDLATLLPAAIPQKENVAFLAGLLLEHTDRDQAQEWIARYVKTATDVLRLAVAMSGGDVSLAKPAVFRTFSRPERRLLVALLNKAPNLIEDMLRWKGRWIRLGEKLHPGEHAARYANVNRAFDVIRNDRPYTTFNGDVERSLAAPDVRKALIRLASRPGELARRLDHLLRIDASLRDDTLAAFVAVARDVSTPVLLQVRHHFDVRPERPDIRVFFPKGDLAKSRAVENSLPDLPDDVCRAVVSASEEALVARFRALPHLGRVYVDEDLRDYMVPFALRSASKALRTLVRGSRLPLPAGDILRFFVWWKNGVQRTDLDLSATLLDDQFAYVDVLAYYNLRGFGGVHSSDIVDAPNGASEFIDISLSRVHDAGIRYVAMTVHSYTTQPFVDLPECFAGWMGRQAAGSGEIYEPKTVQDRLDLTAETRIALPLVIDVQDRKVVWCDMGLRRRLGYQNHVQANLGGIGATLRSLVTMRRPNLYDLFRLHAEARGELVATPEEADVLFSVASGTPFRVEEIAAEYMA